MVVSAASMQMQVNLFVSGRKLKDMDTFSKSDPQCILYEQKNNQWVKIGQTEQIQNSLNPDFQASFTVGYFFEKVQNFKFLMIDGDGGADYDTIGEVIVTMGKLMGAKKQIYTEKLSYQGQQGRGDLIVRTQAIQQSNICAQMRLKWSSINDEEGACCFTSPVRYHCDI